MLEVLSAEYLTDFKIICKFNNGIEKIIDFKYELDGDIYLPLQNLEYFKSFKIVLNTIAWDNNADFAPEYLFDIGFDVDLVIHN